MVSCSVALVATGLILHKLCGGVLCRQMLKSASQKAKDETTVTTCSSRLLLFWPNSCCTHCRAVPLPLKKVSFETYFKLFAWKRPPSSLVLLRTKEEELRIPKILNTPHRFSYIMCFIQTFEKKDFLPRKIWSPMKVFKIYCSNKNQFHLCFSAVYRQLQIENKSCWLCLP